MPLTRPLYQPLLDRSQGRWLIAKYHSTCKCGNHISPGDDLWYIPYNKTTRCSPCQEKNYPPALKALLNIK